jgi:hypothetical protein
MIVNIYSIGFMFCVCMYLQQNVKVSYLRIYFNQYQE